ncbi:MAG: hypothetical protein QNJ46_17520 [Leptolyngbyaceae cyanobacterium MO_188.B28]|nr:hypothetical protein [Leptolyngbyaceae cyanobacterium MO_188.B28]
MNHPNGDRLDRLETLAETTLLAIQQLATQQRQAQTDLAANISDVVSMIAINSQHIEEMQQHMEEMQAEVRGLQVENRHILEELADIRRQRG